MKDLDAEELVGRQFGDAVEGDLAGLFACIARGEIAKVVGGAAPGFGRFGLIPGGTDAEEITLLLRTQK